MMKRLVTALTALSIMVGLLPVAYADTTTSGSSPEVTVVGKRIIDDDQYFEISLEVNGDYEDYSSVGVVVKYDPSLIVPTTWDEEAMPVDMSASTSWATRRALPTLGKDTWTTHTALTYITQETDASGTTKDVGYLYLGAEYPGILPNESDVNATPDPNATAAPTADPSATVEPTLGPDDDPHTNPVVVARFMYKDDTSQNTIVQKWTDAWDADWTLNTIMTVAPDDVTSVSPAQFGFAYYKSDFSMKAFQFDYTDTILETTEQATKDDIEIVLGYGESAKSGGLTLNDIYVVLFYDWDDSLLGTFTCGVGEDSSADINEYIKTEFVHPELQTQTTAQLTSKARTDNYRGEYPHTGPNSTNPTIPGGTGTFPDYTEVLETDPDSGVVTKKLVANTDGGFNFPLTNKLEYCFAGRDFNTDEDGNALAFVGGWTKVAAATMKDTWTALDSATNFKQTYDGDGDEVADVDADGNLVDADGNVIDMVSFNFADVKETDLENGTMSVKAVYVPGENLDYGSVQLYTVVEDSFDCTALTNPTATACTYSLTFQYKRINSSGYGVTRLRDPKIKMQYNQPGVANKGKITVGIENGDVIDVELTPTKDIEELYYTLIEMNNLNIESGTNKSTGNELGSFVDSVTNEYYGYVQRGAFRRITELLYEYDFNGGSAVTLNLNIINDIGIKSSATGGKYTAITANSTAKTAIRNFIKAAMPIERANGLSDKEILKKITYYQLQYHIIKKEYVDPATAEEFCRNNYSWCKTS